MIEFVKTFIWVVAAVGLFLIQKWLSSRKVVWLGSIMPVLTIISGGTLIWYMKWEISVRTVLPFVLLFVLFTITWLSERATLKKSRSKEDIHAAVDQPSIHDALDHGGHQGLFYLFPLLIGIHLSWHKPSPPFIKYKIKK